MNTDLTTRELLAIGAVTTLLLVAAVFVHTAVAVGLIPLAAGVWAYREYQQGNDPREAGREAGAAAVDAARPLLVYAGRFAGGVAAGAAMAVTRVMPKSESLWRGVAKRGLRGIYKTAGGNPDAVGIIHRETGQLDLEPVKWKRGDPDEPTDPPRWATKAGESWHPGAEGRDTDFIGTVPVALFDEDAETKGSFLQSRFQAALDIGQKDKLFVPERVEQVIVQLDPEAAAEGGPEAIADGGAVQNQTVYEIPDSEWPDKLTDVLVDLGSPGENGGMRVSAKQFKEVYHEKVGSEEMQMQELRGRAAEADPNAAKDKIKLVLYAALGGALVARSPELLAVIMGSGVGDAISGLNPFTVMPYLPGVLF